MRLVVGGDGLFGDAAVAAEAETGAERPAPALRCAGLPLRTGDLGAWLPRPGHPDGLGDEFGGTPCPLHGKFGEHGAGKLIHGPAWLLALQRAHGLCEFFQAEDADGVIEQAQLGACRTWRHLATVTDWAATYGEPASPRKRVAPRYSQDEAGHPVVGKT